MNGLLNAIETLIGRKVEVHYEKSRKIDVPSNILDITLARQLLKWKPTTDIEQGLKNTYEYLLRLFNSDVRPREPKEQKQLSFKDIG